MHIGIFAIEKDSLKRNKQTNIFLLLFNYNHFCFPFASKRTKEQWAIPYVPITVFYTQGCFQFFLINIFSCLLFIQNVHYSMVCIADSLYQKMSALQKVCVPLNVVSALYKSSEFQNVHRRQSQKLNADMCNFRKSFQF